MQNTDNRSFFLSTSYAHNGDPLHLFGDRSHGIGATIREGTYSLIVYVEGEELARFGYDDRASAFAFANALCEVG